MKPTVTTHNVAAPNGRQAKATFVVFDSGPGMAQWALDNGATSGLGNSGTSWSDISGKDICRYAIDGNLDMANASDAMLARFESFAPVTQAWENTDNVIGASPNVPNYISGNPHNMRLRKRVQKETAPLAIIVDSTSSGGINASHVNKRGSAILAFVRAISARRPVELWVCAGLGQSNGGAVFTCNRIETAPMDLSHAAPCIASVAWSRMVGYDVCQRHGSNGSWPFNHRGPLTQFEMESAFRHAFPHLGETLCIPGIYLTDELVRNPEAWIQRNLALYSGNGED